MFYNFFKVISSTLLCFFLLSGASAEARNRERQLGLVISVTGEVMIYRGKAPQAAVVGFILQPGDTIIAKRGARCSGFTPGGERFDTNKGPARFILSGFSTEKRASGIAAWIARQVAQWVGQSRSEPLLARASRDWKQDTEAPKQIIPAPDGSVRARESRFFWTTISGIDRYEVTIAPEKGKEIAQQVRDHKIVRNDLKPGAHYVWKVSAKAEQWHGSSEWRSFRVMMPEEERELDASLKDLPDLEAGVLLLSVGLHEEAIYRFDSAVSSAMDLQSALRWRAQALHAIGFHKEAYKDLVRATVNR